MRYMLLMQGTHADWQGFGSWPPEDIRAHVAFMTQLDRDLEASGELLGLQGLTGPEQAQLVRARGGEGPAITRAPLLEMRQFLLAYWVVDCEHPQRAAEIAARVSAAPGRGGLPLNLAVEVRPLMRAPGEEM